MYVPVTVEESADDVAVVSELTEDKDIKKEIEEVKSLVQKGELPSVEKKVKNEQLLSIVLPETIGLSETIGCSKLNQS